MGTTEPHLALSAISTISSWYCLGAQLAKLEYAIILQELAKRLPGLCLQPGQTYEFARTMSFRIPTALQLEWNHAA